MTTMTVKAPTATDTNQLTPRELEVVGHVSQGKKNPQIARELGVGEETIKSHIKNSLRKLGAKNRAHAVAICLRRGEIA